MKRSCLRAQAVVELWLNTSLLHPLSSAFFLAPGTNSCRVALQCINDLDRLPPWGVLFIAYSTTNDDKLERLSIEVRCLPQVKPETSQNSSRLM